jgi:acyl carrier protein
MADIDRQAILMAFTGQLRRVCECEDIVVSPDTNLEAIPQIDSLRLLLAIAHLEQQFGVEIDVAAFDSFRHVGDILSAVASARPAGTAAADESAR